MNIILRNGKIYNHLTQTLISIRRYTLPFIFGHLETSKKLQYQHHNAFHIPINYATFVLQEIAISMSMLFQI